MILYLKKTPQSVRSARCAVCSLCFYMTAIFMAAFGSTWQTDTVVREVHSGFQIEAKVFKEAYWFCGTWTIFSVKIIISPFVLWKF